MERGSIALMTGWYSLEVLKANKLRRQAKELELTIRRSRTGLQLINKYGAIVLGKKKGATMDEITERLDFIEKRASWARPEPKMDRPNTRNFSGVARKKLLNLFDQLGCRDSSPRRHRPA
jgi:hypothetical protein